ncbi:hypothetical protein BDEG_27819 [Batrachochytrium dendrobatidis JEL423]|uniref:Uncharacterized protein n=1 Tax=Batrachochytrium dendrobatidis (strain JEL423) TaxID=403673 RepID=A0A177WYB9_BATDL|nr:hypothetical protein BDEG_27819 [Batrachochytrium dendrobatidis JEL423]
MVPVSSPGTWSDNDRDQTDAVPRGMCRGGVGWMGKWEMSEDDVQRHGVQGPCPKDVVSKDMVSEGHVPRTGGSEGGPCPNGPCPKDHVQMSKWTRGPRPKVMAFLNDKLTQCLYKTMLKQQHCTSQGQTVMN